MVTIFIDDVSVNLQFVPASQRDKERDVDRIVSLLSLEKDCYSTQYKGTFGLFRARRRLAHKMAH